MYPPAASSTLVPHDSQTGPPFVAIVDDDRSVQTAIKDLIESAGLAAQCYGSAEEFLGSERWHETACLVLDFMMPGMSGLEMQARLKTLGSPLPIIFITAHGDSTMQTEAMKAGAEVLLKPFDDEVLLERVRAALRS